MTTQKFNKTLFRSASQTLALTAVMMTAASCTQAPAQSQPAAKQSALLGQDGAMTVATASTIVNRYAALKMDASKGQNDITVDGIASLLPLAPGDMLMVIQMQGADIDQTDTAAYGTITNLNSAGRHEFVTVSSVTGDTITIDGACSGLQFDYSAAAHVQVVRVPQVSELVVEAGASLTAPKWDGKVGGIVAVHVDGMVTVHGAIDVSGLGFRGGAVDNDSAKLSDDITLYRSSQSADGAEKGESIAGGPAEYDAMGGRFGRGAPANGGGGGNSFNAGGGGGANGDSAASYLGTGIMDGSAGTGPWTMDPDVLNGPGGLCASSGGGRGGYTYSALAADPMMDGPGSTTWGGNARAERGGRGGHPLSNSFEGRVFLGGGGGAGDGNDGAGGAGGPGGGIVYLIARGISGSGGIYASGQPGEQGGSMAVDGAGGGGAGGAVVLRADAVDGVSVVANGAIGGQQLSSGIDAAGPGGGGSGGFVAVPSGFALTSALGGAAGQSTSSTLLQWNVNGATIGAAGQAYESSVVSLGGGSLLCAPADIALSLTGRNGDPIPGAEILYSFSVTNRGAVRSRFTKIQDEQPSAIRNARWRCTAQNGAICPTDSGVGAIDLTADLPPGGQLDFEVVLPIPTTVTGSMSYSVSGIPSSVVTEQSAGDNRIEISDVLTPQADLVATVSAESSKLHVGDKNRYTLQVANRGFSAAAATIAKLSLTSGVHPTVDSANGWQCSVSQSVVTCTRPELAVGLASDIVVSVTAPAGIKEMNATAEVMAAQTADPMLANNSSWFGVTVEEAVTPPPPVTNPPAAEPAMGCSVSPAAGPQNSLWAAVVGLVLAVMKRNRRRSA
jgi:hypothetical protein